MGDDAAVITGTPIEQPAIVNGFDRLAAATAAPASPATATDAPGPPPQPAAGQLADTEPLAPTGDKPAAAQPPAMGQAATAVDEEVTPYSHDPHLLPEHALLGSLLHAPTVLDDLEHFLGVRDFATPQTRAVYATLRGLHQAGTLFDVTAMPTHAQRLDAANENHLQLFTALRYRPPQYTTIPVTNIPTLMAHLNAAAPMESLPLRGVYDPTAQLRLGRMVLEASCRRQLHAIGVRMQRATPLVTPARTTPEPAQRAASHLASNLETTQRQLRAMTDRLLQAVHRTTSNTTEPAATAAQDRTPSAATQRWPVPDPLRALSAPLRHRAERHLLHLTLHAGTLNTLPAEILSLTPEDFTTTRHANLWRTIKDLHARGLPVNYVAVFLQTRNEGFAHQPMPSDRDLIRMAQRPELKPDRVARSLNTIVTAALTRATKHTHHRLTALAANTTAPIETVLTQATQQVDALATRANTATQHHEHTTPPPTQPRGRHHRA